MASGNTHDRVGAIIGAIASFLYPNPSFVVGNIVGLLWLSPDMDTRSNPYYRWGPLAFVWNTFHHFTRHRGVTHIPVIGVLVLHCYLAIILFFLLLGFSITNNGIIEQISSADWGPIAIMYWNFTLGHLLQQLTHLTLDWMADRKLIK